MKKRLIRVCVSAVFFVEELLHVSKIVGKSAYSESDFLEKVQKELIKWFGKNYN